MRIPFGHRQLAIDVEKVAPAIPGQSVLDGASDQEMERFVRSARIVREPRWDAHGLMYGIRR